MHRCISLLNLLNGVKVKKMYRLSMWLVHGIGDLPWMPKFGQFLADFGLKREYLVIFFKKMHVSKLDLLGQRGWA